MPVNVTVARENWDRYVYSRDGGHLDYVKKARKCEDFFAGLQWEETIRRAMDAARRPVITINETFASLAALMGAQLANRADVGFMPSRTGDQETANTLNKLWLHTARTNRYNWLEAEVAADGFITSRGYIDVRANFDDQLLGEVAISKVNPLNVVIDADAEEYLPKEWNEVTTTKWMTPEHIGALYSKEDAEYLSKRPRSEFRFGTDSIVFDRPRFDAQSDNQQGRGGLVQLPWEQDNMRRFIRVVERQYRVNERCLHFVDPRTGDMRLVPQNWEKERYEEFAGRVGLALVKKYARRIKWVATADDVELHNTDSPYKEFTVVPYFPYFRYGRTIGFVEQALSPQEMLNKLLSSELHVVITTANSGYKVKAGALQNMSIEQLEQRGAESGIVIELTDVSHLEKIQPNQVPTGLDNLASRAHEFTKRVLNTPDAVRGFDRSDVAARSTDLKAKMAEQAGLAKPLDNLNLTRTLVAERCLDIWQAYYTDERVYTIMGQGPKRNVETISLNQVQPDGSVLNDLTIGEYAATVTAVPPRETMEMREFDELLQLRQLQIPVPDEFMIEASSVARKTELLQSMSEQSGESAEKQQQLMQLEAEAATLQNELTKADIAKRVADARLSEARAQTEEMAAQAGPGGELDQMETMSEIQNRRRALSEDLERKMIDLEAKLQAKQEEIALKKQAAQLDASLKIRGANQDAQIKQQDHQLNQQLRRESATVDNQVKRRRAAQQPAKKAAGGSRG